MRHLVPIEAHLVLVAFWISSKALACASATSRMSSAGSGGEAAGAGAGRVVRGMLAMAKVVPETAFAQCYGVPLLLPRQRGWSADAGAVDIPPRWPRCERTQPGADRPRASLAVSFQRMVTLASHAANTAPKDGRVYRGYFERASPKGVMTRAVSWSADRGWVDLSGEPVDAGWRLSAWSPG